MEAWGWGASNIFHSVDVAALVLGEASAAEVDHPFVVRRLFVTRVLRQMRSAVVFGIEGGHPMFCYVCAYNCGTPGAGLKGG
jgi:hypothetical protein